MSEGSAVDCLFVEALVVNTAADKLLANKAYGIDAIGNLVAVLRMAPLSHQRFTARCA